MGIEKISTNVQQVQPQKVPEPKNPQIRDDQPQNRDVDIKISDEALRLQRKEAEAPINQEKVNEIKKAIENGTFKVDPEKIADKMRDEANEIMKRRLQQAYNNKKGNEGVLGA